MKSPYARKTRHGGEGEVFHPRSRFHRSNSSLLRSRHRHLCFGALKRVDFDLQDGKAQALWQILYISVHEFASYLTIRVWFRLFLPIFYWGASLGGIKFSITLNMNVLTDNMPLFGRKFR